MMGQLLVGAAVLVCTVLQPPQATGETERHHLTMTPLPVPPVRCMSSQLSGQCYRPRRKFHDLSAWIA